jgi:hypothetical protein
MISSIVVTGTYNIGMNSAKKIKVDNNVLSVEKEIPFIRYRFDKYEETEYEYIKNMMQQFSISTHLAEIKLNENSSKIIDELTEKVGSIAKYIYIEVTDTDVANGALTEETLNMFETVAEKDVDRFMFKDKSSTLDTVATKKFIKQCMTNHKFTGSRLSESKFGVCSSPLSFGEMACLTAVKARELMSIYSKVSDVALPSANHQCMNCCGCIRYMVVTSDLEAPSEGKQKSAGRTKKDSESGSSETISKPKVVKQTVQLGMYDL